jgi:hypothetical protein
VETIYHRTSVIGITEREPPACARAELRQHRRGRGVLAHYEVLLAGIWEQADGLYSVADRGTVEDLPGELRVRRRPQEPLTEATALSLLSRARVVLRGRDAKLDAAAVQQLSEQFDLFVSYNDFSVFVRRP